MFIKGTSAFTKFFISAAITIIILAICLTFALRYVIENSFIRHVRESTAYDILLQAKDLKPEDFNFDNPQYTKDVFQKFHDQMIDSEIIRLKIWDTKGRIIYSDDESLIGRIFDDKEYQKSLQGTAVSLIETRSKAEQIYGEVYNQALEVYVPITFNGSSRIVGVIEVYSKLDSLNNIIDQIEIVQVISTITFILACFILFYFLFKFFIYKSLNQLISVIGSYKSGDLSRRVHIETDDEIGKLGTSFNEMAEKLREYYSQLEQKVRIRTEELEIAKSHYQSLFENSPTGIGLADNTGKIIFANNTMEKLFGYSIEELKKLNIADTHANKDDAKKVLEIFKKTGKLSGFYSPLKRKDKSIFDALISISNFHQEDQELMQATILDITAQKNAERQLAEHTNELERTQTAVVNLLEDLRVAKSEIETAKIKDDAILENIGEGLIVTDTSGKILLVNRATANMLRWEITDLLGQDLEKVLLIEDEKGNPITGNNRLSQKVLKTCKTLERCAVSESNYYVRKDKTKFPVSVIAAPIIINHKITGVVEIFRDISREKEIDKEKSEFLSIAAHQLRTPLGSMRWSIEMLLSGDFGIISEDIKDILIKIYKTDQSMISLVNDLLDVSRIDQGRISNNPELINIIEILKSSMEQMWLEAKDKGVVINLSGDSEKFPQILIDPLHLSQVLNNLMSNAVKYNIYQGKVDINIEKLENSIKISITNTGKSIPEEEQGRLFTRFFRGKAAVKSEISGTGLGLYVVKFYTDAWGGKVSVKSPSLDNQGVTFYLEIPLKPKI